MELDIFLDSYKHVMLPEEIEELKNERANFERIYFAGSIPRRHQDDL